MNEFVRYLAFFVAGIGAGAFSFHRDFLWIAISIGSLLVVWLFRPSTDATVRQ